MKIPGPTTYTKDSEIENAETSAIGRAIAALGFEVHRSYASANEVANKQDEVVSDKPKESARRTSRSTKVATPTPLESGPAEVNPETDLASRNQQDELKSLAAEHGLTKDEMSVLRKAHTDKAKSSEFTVSDYEAMKNAIVATGQIKTAAGEGSEVIQ
jgi:hypothetical protein